jgi:DNA invertase Pin-like site-specific DNA recombinase
VKVALYARVSTPEQNNEAQISELEAYCGRRGFTVYEWYSDTASGSEKRKASAAPGFKKLMKDAHARRFDAVLVWKLDRFNRSFKALVDALGEFSALGIDFISITQAIDTTTPSGKLFFHMLAAFAEFEREIIVERVNLGISKARARGQVFGRRRNPDMEDRVCGLKASGLSIRRIAKETGRSRAGVSLILKREYNRGQV